MTAAPPSPSPCVLLGEAQGGLSFLVCPDTPTAPFSGPFALLSREKGVVSHGLVSCGVLHGHGVATVRDDGFWLAAQFLTGRAAGAGAAGLASLAFCGAFLMGRPHGAFQVTDGEHLARGVAEYGRMVGRVWVQARDGRSCSTPAAAMAATAAHAEDGAAAPRTSSVRVAAPWTQGPSSEERPALMLDLPTSPAAEAFLSSVRDFFARLPGLQARAEPDILALTAGLRQAPRSSDAEGGEVARSAMARLRSAADQYCSGAANARDALGLLPGLEADLLAALAGMASSGDVDSLAAVARILATVFLETAAFSAVPLVAALLQAGLARAPAAVNDDDDVARSWVAVWLGGCLAFSGEYERAARVLDEALARWRPDDVAAVASYLRLARASVAVQAQAFSDAPLASSLLSAPFHRDAEAALRPRAQRLLAVLRLAFFSDVAGALAHVEAGLAAEQREPTGPAMDSRVKLLAVESQCLLARGHILMAVEAARRTSALAEELGSPALTAVVQTALAPVLSLSGRSVGEARVSSVQALAESRRLVSPSSEGAVLSAMIAAAVEAKDETQATLAVAELRELSAARAEPRVLADLKRVVVLRMRPGGGASDARAAAVDALAEASRLKNPMLQAMALQQLGSLYLACPELGTEAQPHHIAALSYFQELLRVSAEAGSLTGTVPALLGISHAHLFGLGDPETAERLIEEALAAARSSGMVLLEATALRGKARLAKHLGNNALALANLQLAAKLCADTGNVAGQVDALLASAKCCDPAQAKRVTQDALFAASSDRSAPLQVRVLLELGRLCLGSHAAEEAAMFYQKAAHLASLSGPLTGEAAAHWGLSRARVMEGNRRDALDHASSAEAAALRSGDTALWRGIALHLAEQLFLADDRARCAEICKSVLERFPGDRAALQMKQRAVWGGEAPPRRMTATAPQGGALPPRPPPQAPARAGSAKTPLLASEDGAAKRDGAGNKSNKLAGCCCVTM